MTIVLKKVDPAKAREFKAEAARRGVGLSEAFELAIRAWISQRKSQAVVTTDAQANNVYYESNRDELLKLYPGKVVVIAHGRLVGVFESTAEASSAMRQLSPRPNHAIVTRIGVDRRETGEWLGGSLEL